MIETDALISCLNYGPLDNGHVLVGLDNGELLVFEYPCLDLIESIKVFDHAAITCVTFDPTNYVFVSSSDG